MPRFKAGEGFPTGDIARISVFAALIALLVPVAAGLPVQAAVMGVSLGETALLSAAFLPGDVIKVVLASIVTKGTQRAYPDAVPAVHRERLRAGEVGSVMETAGIRGWSQ